VAWVATLFIAGFCTHEARAGIALIVTAPHSPPPALRIERPGTAPFKEAVWVDGRWDWRGGQYVWVAGHWQQPPPGHHRWQTGAWSERQGSWFFNPGRWL